jgi:basic membrane lipoprotein Med (substrate-binding protein (PBP1-ABC) superfamily)
MKAPAPFTLASGSIRSMNSGTRLLSAAMSTSSNMWREKPAELRRDGKGVLVNTGFVYTAPYADIITDMAAGDQGFGITDAAIPFYQIALHGLVPYTGKAINLAEDYTRNLLEIIASGAGLYFSFMTKETAALQETKFWQFYANEYGK